MQWLKGNRWETDTPIWRHLLRCRQTYSEKNRRLCGSPGRRCLGAYCLSMIACQGRAEGVPRYFLVKAGRSGRDIPMRDCPKHEDHHAFIGRFLGHCTVGVRDLGSIFTQPCVLHIGILDVAFADENCVDDLPGEKGESW